MRRLIPVLFAVTSAACQCGDAPHAIAPQIYMDVCATPQRKVNGQLIGGFQDCKYDFGVKDISVKQTKSIRVTNPSIVALNLSDEKGSWITIEGDPQFKIEHAPDTIEKGLSGDIIISVRPSTETDIHATLYVKSDANNTEQTPDGFSLIAIPLSATGVDNGLPDINVTPLDCNFDHVPVGGVKQCPVKIENTGTRGLVLDVVDFIPPTDGAGDPLFQAPTGSTQVPFAFIGRPPGPDEEIAPTAPPNAPVTLTVNFTPDALGNYQGKFHILSNDPDEPDIAVTLSGIAVTPPTCVVKIKSVNGVDVNGSAPQLEPLDDVVFTLEDSTPSVVGGSISGYQWNDPPSGPPASHVRYSNPTGQTTGFTFAGNKVGVDFAGTYKVSAQVFDDLGTPSVNECSLTFEAIPHDNFLVELSWDTPTEDFDLHVTKQAADGRFCISNTSGVPPSGLFAEDCDSSLDCNFATCTPGDTGVEWDGVSGHTVGDPSLDIDDIDGFGPENTNIDIMGPGDYLVSVNEYQGTSQGPATGQVRIFIFGQLAGQFTKGLSPGDYWEIALVHWPADITAERPCVEDLMDGNATDDCP